MQVEGLLRLHNLPLDGGMDIFDQAMPYRTQADLTSSFSTISEDTSCFCRKNVNLLSPQSSHSPAFMSFTPLLLVPSGVWHSGGSQREILYWRLLCEPDIAGAGLPQLRPVSALHRQWKDVRRRQEPAFLFQHHKIVCWTHGTGLLRNNVTYTAVSCWSVIVGLWWTCDEKENKAVSVSNQVLNCTFLLGERSLDTITPLSSITGFFLLIIYVYRYFCVCVCVVIFHFLRFFLI